MEIKYRQRSKKVDRDLRFRIPRELLRDIELCALKNGRSRNSEILVRLAKSLAGDSGYLHQLSHDIAFCE